MKRESVREPIAVCKCKDADCALIRVLARAVREASVGERTQTVELGHARIANHEAAGDA